MPNTLCERFDELYDRLLKQDGLAVRDDDRHCYGLYYNATTIGMGKRYIYSFIKKEIEEAEERMKRRCLGVIKDEDIV